jgi:hypothetical protein
MVVAQYRVHFVDHGDRIFDGLVIEHESDEEAVEHANRLHVASIGAGFDVLKEGRLVYRHRN